MCVAVLSCGFGRFGPAPTQLLNPISRILKRSDVLESGGQQQQRTMHHSLLHRTWKKVPLHSRGGSTAHRLGVKIKTEREEKGSVSARRGTLEAVFEQGEECSARGRISGGGERRTSAEQGTKGLEKQCGIKPCEMCWVGSGQAHEARSVG